MRTEKKDVRILENHLAELSVQVLTTTQALIEARRAAGMAVSGSSTVSRNIPTMQIQGLRSGRVK